MVSLIGNSSAFTSFSFGQPATPSAPAPVPNTGQTFVGGGGTTPVFTDPAPQNGISAEQLARIAMKDEANTFTEPQTIDTLKSGIFENVASTLDTVLDDSQDSKQKLVRVENTTDGLIVSSKVRSQGFEIDDSSVITDVATALTNLDNKTEFIVIQDVTLPSGLIQKITRFDGVVAFMLGLSIADGRDISFDGDTTTLANFKSKIATLEGNHLTTNELIANNKAVADTRHTDVSTLITNNKTTADTNHTNLTATVTDNKTTADTNHTTLNNLITTANADITNLEADTTAHDGRLNALEDTLEKVTHSGNNLNFDNNIVLASGRTFKYDKSGVETNLITQLESIEASIGSSRTDAELTTFINNHALVRTDTELSNFIKNDGEFVLVENRVDALEDKFDDVSTTTSQIEFNKTVQILPPFKIFAEYFDDVLGMVHNLDIAQILGKTRDKTEGFTRNHDLTKTTFSDAMEMTVSKFGVYKNSVTGFKTLFPDVGERVSFDVTDTIQNQLAGLGDSTALNTELALMFNFRDNGSFDSNGAFSKEYVFGIPINGFGASSYRTRTRNTMRLLGEEIFLGRKVGTFYEVTDETSPENVEIPLRATLLDYISFRDNIDTNIDARLTTVTTTVTGETVSSLIHNNLTSTGLITNYSITGKFQGQWVGTANRGSPVLGFFTGSYHPLNTTWGLFVFGLLDGTLLKMAGKYFDTADDNLPFKEDAFNSRWSREFLYPTGLDGNDPKFREFIVKSWNSASIIKTGANPNNSGTVEQLTDNTIPHATLPNFAGYGVDTLVSSVVTRGLEENVRTLTTDVGNRYTKTESDTLYAPVSVSATATANHDEIHNATTGIKARLTNVETSSTGAESRLTAIEAKTARFTNTTTGFEVNADFFFGSQIILINYTNASGTRAINVSNELGEATDNIATIQGQLANLATSANLTSLTNTVTTLTTTVNDNKTEFDNLQVNHRLTTNALDIGSLRTDVDIVSNLTANMLLDGGLLKFQNRVLFQDEVKVRNDIPTLVHLGKGQVLYDFPSGEADIPTKIINIEDNGFFQLPNDNSGKTLKCDQVQVKRGSVYQNVLTSDDFQELLINSVDATTGSVQQNTVLIAGANFFTPLSPFPFIYVDTDGRLGSASLDSSIWADNCFGHNNRGIDALGSADDVEKRFNSGLVPKYEARNPATNERIGSSITLLTAEGTWRKLSDIFVENGVSTVSVSENLPDFVPITHNNRFAMSSQVNGGTIVYNEANTSMIQEHSSNLYHTPARVNTLITNKLSDGSITTAVINDIETQTLTAVSDRRKKTEIKPLTETIEKLNPVEFEYLNDRGKTRFGFIAQEVQESNPTLVDTDSKGYLSVKYLDIIAMLVKENQELTKRIEKLENFVEKK